MLGEYLDFLLQLFLVILQEDLGLADLDFQAVNFFLEQSCVLGQLVERGVEILQHSYNFVLQSPVFSVLEDDYKGHSLTNFNIKEILKHISSGQSEYQLPNLVILFGGNCTTDIAEAEILVGRGGIGQVDLIRDVLLNVLHQFQMLHKATFDVLALYLIVVQHCKLVVLLLDVLLNFDDVGLGLLGVYYFSLLQLLIKQIKVHVYVLFANLLPCLNPQLGNFNLDLLHQI